MTESPHRPYYPALDGLRGVAIILVVFHHNFGFIRQSYFGWLGVDLFFVLSGFLITDILLREINSPHLLRNFYMRRALRILPLYYVSLSLFLFIAAPLTDTRLHWDYYLDNQFFIWTHLQNWLYIFRNPGNAEILNHYWSLAVEEQFYIFWPLVILVLKKPRRLLYFISLLLAIVILFRLGLWLYKIETLFYYNLYTFTRIDGICIGCLVALLAHLNFYSIRKYTTSIVIGFALANFLFFFINREFDYSFPYLALVGYTTFGMIFGLLVYETVTRETPLLNRVLDTALLRFFGRISYGLYIFHWPVYLLTRSYCTPALEQELGKNAGQIAISIAATLLAILISWSSRRYFEKHFLSLKGKFNSPAVIS